MKTTIKQYAQALYKLTKDKSQKEIDVVLEKFVANLKSEQKLKTIEQIVKQFVEIYNKENRIISARVLTGRKIDEDTIENIKNKLKEKYQAEKIELETMIDKKLKGGIKIIVGEDILDGSIAGRLAKLKNSLVG